MKKHKKARSLSTLLHDCRSHYLDFLRNLTPQIAILTLTMFLGARIYWDPSGFQEWLFVAILLTLFCYASWANSTHFYEGCFPLWSRWRKHVFARARRLNMGPFQTLNYMFSAFMRLWLEATAVISFFLLGSFFVAIVAIFATGAARQMWDGSNYRATQKTPMAEQSTK